MNIAYRLFSLLLFLLCAPLSMFLLLREVFRLVVARRCGVKVFALVVGCGKEVWQTMWRGTLISVRVLPIGCYLEVDDLPATRFQALPFLKKITVTLAGPAALLGISLLLIFSSQFLYGRVVFSSEPIVGRVLPEYPAALAGVREGDRIVAIDDREIASWDSLLQVLSATHGKELSLKVKRNSEELEFVVSPRVMAAGGRPSIGIVRKEERQQPSVWNALVGSMSAIRGVGRSFLSTLSQQPQEAIFIQASSPSLAASTGGELFFSYLFLASASLLFITLLPIPLLFDGGHVLVHCVEALRGQALESKYTYWSNRLGLALIPILMLASVLQLFL